MSKNCSLKSFPLPSHSTRTPTHFKVFEKNPVDEKLCNNKHLSVYLMSCKGKPFYVHMKAIENDCAKLFLYFYFQYSHTCMFEDYPPGIKPNYIDFSAWNLELILWCRVKRSFFNYLQHDEDFATLTRNHISYREIA